MSRENLLVMYLSDLEKAKFELERAEKTSSIQLDPIERVRWSLEAEVRRSLVRVYDQLVKLVQELG
ncbi:MAG TPA: hypothetical protein VGD60_14710 [Candidatus Acidoferrales bacterium]